MKVIPAITRGHLADKRSIMKGMIHKMEDSILSLLDTNKSHVRIFATVKYIEHWSVTRVNDSQNESS